MNTEQRAHLIIKLLRPQYPRPRTALRYQTAFQLLVAVILSAQCTDKKVNEVIAPIFKKYRTAKDFAKIPIPQLEHMVKQTGFYHAKARAISVTAKLVAMQFKNRVPLNMEELITLRGVGRKVANVVIGELTGKAVGVTVDTHVRRLSQRLKLTKRRDPITIERDLMKIVPKKDWVLFPHFLILHGRKTCSAQRPRCDECVLNKICPSAFRFPHFQKS